MSTKIESPEVLCQYERGGDQHRAIKLGACRLWQTQAADGTWSQNSDMAPSELALADALIAARAESGILTNNLKTSQALCAQHSETITALRAAVPTDEGPQ